MPSSFAVTAATNTVILDEQRRGETAFTVSNISGHPLRGRARVVPENPAAEKWLTLVGEAERDFPIAGTQQYVVQIAVPPDAPAGSYPFHLDMVGVGLPDEDFMSGPTVTFEVQPVRTVRPFPWWILVVVLVILLIVGGIVAFVLFGPKPKPPVVNTPTTTVTLTATPLPGTDTPTPTPTATPLFVGGLVTYKVSEGGGVSLYAVLNDGQPVALVTGVTDAEVLDFSPPAHRFALWVSQGGTESVLLVGQDGSSPVTVNAGWTTVQNADFSPDGQHVIVQAVAGGAVGYYYYDAQGNLVNP